VDALVSRPARQPSIIEWGWAGRALGDSTAGLHSGDLHVVASFPDGALVAVIDGLGHGPEAAAAARAAARVLEAQPSEPVLALLEQCHADLRRTRGAVMSLASFDARASTITVAGVGNVEGVLLRGNPVAARPREDFAPRGGIVGYQLPPLRATSIPVLPNDTLIMATDGIRGGFATRADLRGHPQDIADTILTSHGKRSDDALVLVVRYLGPPT
jgi:phosphoserine phosphatase RsbX